ncbi:hypothetical protein ACOJQI_21335 [Bacillus salacetis]|uniref:hypothetical protein n=1 Tax=Bacillus salacetis TaxID=2315464 RepID=UPI003B9DD919
MKAVSSILFIRKFLAAWAVTFILVIGMLLLNVFWNLFIDPEIDMGFVWPVLSIAFLVALAGNLFYALPLSLLAEFISRKMIRVKPFVTSLLVHIAVGMICFTFLGWDFGIYGFICCVLFFFVDFYFSKIPKLNDN